MRVITGTARGRKLKEPENYDVRPTTDRVKESMFNIIQFDIEGRRVLDLFAGTGQLGIEALSRGAAHAVFTDDSPVSVKTVRENVKMTGFEKVSSVIQCDAIAYIGRGEKFDIIFLDPPYDTKLLDIALEKIFEFDILKENGIIVCESRAEKVLPAAKEPYYMRKEYKYGKIKVTLYSR